jgi:hypothetical protein
MVHGAIAFKDHGKSIGRIREELITIFIPGGLACFLQEPVFFIVPFGGKTGALCYFILARIGSFLMQV